MKRRILFAPIQTGIAHIIRTLAIAEVINQKYEVLFIIDRQKAKILPIASKIKKILIDPADFDNKEGVVKLFSNKIGEKKTIFYTDHYISLFKKYKPALVVNDSNYLAFFACLVLDLPYVVITNSLLFPYRKGMVGHKPETFSKWLFGGLTSFIANTWLHLFFRAGFSTMKHYKKPVLSPQDFLEKVNYIIPEPKEYNIIRKYHPNVYYVGPIVHKKFETRDLAWERQTKKLIGNKKAVYITFGGTGYGQRLFVNLIKRFLSQGFFVIATTGTAIKIGKILIKNKNLILKRFIPGMSATHIADAVVSHGSYGTIVHAILSEKPIVCIPFNLDQLFHSVKINDLGIGATTMKWGLHHFILDPKKVQDEAEKTKVDVVVKKVREVLTNPKYKKKVSEFARLLKGKNGAAASARIIENLTETKSY